MKITLFILCFLAPVFLFAQTTRYEKSNGTETTTYEECIAFYEALAKKYDQVKIFDDGKTDIGKPLHLIVLSKDKTFDPEIARQKNKLILFINNGIHPGEPEGIDASMVWSRTLLEKNQLPDNVIICIIPIYNVDGAINRGEFFRANQNGPIASGFRGNARNLDLNRDFIKTNSRNSRSFQEYFRAWQPHIFMDNHTTNGADYQHVMTLIATQKDKLHPALSSYMTNRLLPQLYDQMEKRKFPMVHYVNTRGGSVDNGIVGFYESPRYSSGYAALFNCIGFIPETHMLKPFNQRYQSTYELMDIMLKTATKDYSLIIEAKKTADEQTKNQTHFALNHALDTTVVEQIRFMGYQSTTKPSLVSGMPRLFYDRSKPYTKQIPFYNTYRASSTVKAPNAYIIPQAWHQVIDLLALNGVVMKTLQKDSLMKVEMYYIGNFNTPQRPFEGHYVHSNTEVRVVQQQVQFYKGDVIVRVNQKSNRYIVETLEPQAIDSYFNWNFFDSILGQKEYFSAYIFEEIAVELLKNNPELKAKFDERKVTDEAFAKSGQAQLDFIYRNSAYYEKTHNRYPIGRIIE